jgi:hypothetical protein
MRQRAVDYREKCTPITPNVSQGIWKEAREIEEKARLRQIYQFKRAPGIARVRHLKQNQFRCSEWIHPLQRDGGNSRRHKTPPHDFRFVCEGVEFCDGFNY